MVNSAPNQIHSLRYCAKIYEKSLDLKQQKKKLEFSIGINHPIQKYDVSFRHIAEGLVLATHRTDTQIRYFSIDMKANPSEVNFEHIMTCENKTHSRFDQRAS